MREMGFMEKLLDGVEVEWTAINEVLNMRAGQHISASNINDYPDDEYQYPCFGGNGVRGFVKYNSHDGKYLLIGRQGALCGNVQRTDGKFYATEHAVVVSSKRAINLDWAFHLLTMMNLNQYASKSAQPGLAVGKIQSLKIPIPCPKNPKKSLEIQAEIVRILDAMTAHTAELTAELTARKKQYDYYRDKLLSFEEGEVEWRTFGEVANIQRGASPRPIAKYITDDADGVPWIKIGDTSPGSKYVNGTAQKITTTGAKMSRILNKGDFIISNSMSFGRPYILNIKGAIHDGWASISGFSKTLNSDYLYHYLASNAVQNYWVSKINSGSVSNLNADIIKTLPLPIPTISEQKQIATLLDKFDALTSSLTEGLPREIELRQKQYAYYRDKLLSFPAAQAE
ncbi:restriction endonuclease subunit S [Comamonas denitrificans]|uniref:restriction endonuclease subunit S n=1 Tax=Comamonas denitrificans TaxID=117506 RepID=UPI0036104549